MPYWWYLYSALPRAMSASLLLVPVGVFVDRRTLALVFPALAFILPVLLPTSQRAPLHHLCDTNAQCCGSSCMCQNVIYHSPSYERGRYVFV